LNTPKSETKHVEKILEDPTQVGNIIRYLNHMKKYYELEREIRAIFK